MSHKFYFFTCRSQNCRAYVRFNDVPMLEIEPDYQIEQASNITMWALPGSTKLEVSLAKRPDTPASQVHFSASVVWALAGESLNAHPPLFELEWPPDGLGDLVPFYRVFTVDTTTASELWELAEPLSLDDKTKSEVIDYTRKLHQIFASGNHKLLADEMQFRGEDLGLTEGTTKAESDEDQRDFFATIMDPTEFTFKAQPLLEDTLDLRLMGDGKVIRVRRGSDPALLSTEGQGMDVYLSKIGGRWTCSR